MIQMVIPTMWFFHLLLYPLCAVRLMLQCCEQFAETQGLIVMLLYPILSLIHSFLMTGLLKSTFWHFSYFCFLFHLHHRRLHYTHSKVSCRIADKNV